jgi:hypothetical protein
VLIHPLSSAHRHPRASLTFQNQEEKVVGFTYTQGGPFNFSWWARATRTQFKIQVDQWIHPVHWPLSSNTNNTGRRIHARLCAEEQAVIEQRQHESEVDTPGGSYMQAYDSVLLEKWVSATSFSIGHKG